MGLACCASDSKQYYEDVDDEDGERRKSDPFYSRFVDDGDTMSKSSLSSERERRDEYSDRGSSRSSETSHHRSNKRRREKKKESRRKSRRHRKPSPDSSHSDSEVSRSSSRTSKKKPKPVAAKKAHRDRRKSGRHKYERVRSESVSSCSSSRSDENTSDDGRGSISKRRESRRERDKSYRSRKESKYHAVSKSKSHRSKHDKHSKHKKKHKGITTPKTLAEVLSENYASSLPDIPEQSYMSDSHSLPKHKHKEKEKIKHRKLLAQYRESNNTLSSTPSYYRQKKKLTAESNMQSGHTQKTAMPSIRSTMTSDVDGRMSETQLLKFLSDAPVEPRSTPSIKLKKKKKKKDKERGRPKILSLFQRGEQVLFQEERCLVMKVTKEIPPIYTVRSERSRQRYQTDACKLSAWKPTLTTESSAAKYDTSVSVMMSEDVTPSLYRKRSKQVEPSSTRERSRDRSESRGHREREKPKRKKKKKKKKKKKYREGRRDSSSEGRIRDRSIQREGEESIVLKLYE